MFSLVITFWTFIFLLITAAQVVHDLVRSKFRCKTHCSTFARSNTNNCTQTSHCPTYRCASRTSQGGAICNLPRHTERSFRPVSCRPDIPRLGKCQTDRLRHPGSRVGGRGSCRTPCSRPTSCTHVRRSADYTKYFNRSISNNRNFNWRDSSGAASYSARAPTPYTSGFYQRSHSRNVNNSLLGGLESSGCDNWRYSDRLGMRERLYNHCLVTK